MSVYFDNLFDGRGFEEGGRDALFDAKDDTTGRGDLMTELEERLAVGE